MKKRILSLVLALVMTLSLLPATVWASQDAVQAAETVTGEVPLVEEKEEPEEKEETTPQEKTAQEGQDEPQQTPDDTDADSSTPLLTGLLLASGVRQEIATPFLNLTAEKIAAEGKQLSGKADDTYSGVYAWASAAEGYSVTVNGETVANSGEGTQVVTNMKGPAAQTLTVEVKAEDGTVAETYTATITKTLSLKNATLTAGDTKTALTFKKTIKEYDVSVEAGTTEMTLEVTPSNPG